MRVIGIVDQWKFVVMGALALAAGAAVAAGEPIVQGPESVQDWYNAGRQFVEDGRAQRPVMRPARNVILFVGDGMGVSTVTAARILEGQLRGKPGEENFLSFERFPHVALSKTYSWDQQTSDSAPTMTAMVTGYKAREGMLSVDHLTRRGECDAATVAAHSLPTLLEQAAAVGKATGIVSTARVTHATPAANYAHTPVRDWEADSNLPAGCGVKDIARQLIEVDPVVRSSLRVVLGGGRDYFRMASQTDPEYPARRGLRQDGRDLTAEWVSTRGPGAAFVWDRAGFNAANATAATYLLGLFERSHMQYEADRPNDTAGEPSLTEMTDKAIAVLNKNPQGFFLQVEAGRIDHAHHAGNAQRALLDAIELSRAVRRAMEMTDPNETLIIVTADHSHTFTIAGYPHRGNPILGLVSDVPAVDGDPATLSKDRLGLPYTTLAYANGPGWRDAVATGQKRPDLNAVNTADLNYLQEAAVPLGSETHAGEEVAVYAMGPRAWLVHGVMEQNWIYHVMRAAFGY